MFQSRLFVVVAALVLLGASATHAQVPAGLNYQGYLTDAAGQPIDEQVNVIFALYAVETGGSPLWSENVSLLPSQGLFSTELGAGASPFPLGLFDTPLYMGLTIGNDAEMTPRRAFRATPYAYKSSDAERFGGALPSFYATDSALDSVSGQVQGLGIDVSGNTSAINAQGAQISDLDSDIADVASDIGQIQSTASTNASDIAAVESQLPGLQQRVNGTCAAGSSIRVVGSTGTVTCEVDDMGPWVASGANTYFTSGNVGVGTTNPVAGIQIDAPVGTDPFRARTGSSTKLRVHANGSTSLGTSSQGPENGLFVAGWAGIGTSNPTARATMSDDNWQLSLANTGIGGDDWYLGSSATAWSAGAGKFIISPVNNSSAAALLIDANGDVGIDTLDPLARLHVSSGTDVAVADGGYLIMGPVNGSNIGLDNNEIMARSNGSTAPLTINAEGGEVRINTNGSQDEDALEVRGRVYFDNGGNGGMRITGTNSSPTNALLEPTLAEEGLVGVVSRPFWRTYSREFYALSPVEYRTYSDRSLKSNVRPIGNALDMITALEGVSYKLQKNPLQERSRKLTEKEQFDLDNQFGFIAQDVAKILPQLVREDEMSGMQSVGYMGLIPVLVEALKDQQRQIDELKEELAAR